MERLFTSSDHYSYAYDNIGKTTDGGKGDWTESRSELCPQGEQAMGCLRINAQHCPVLFMSADGSTSIESAYDFMDRRAWKVVTRDQQVISHEGYSAEGTLTTSYSPFGAATATGSVTSTLQWSSKIADEELALTYYNYRHYNPADGRWINRDPIAEEGGLNLYGFVGNRVWMSDLLGKVFNTSTDKDSCTITIELKITKIPFYDDDWTDSTVQIIKNNLYKTANYWQGFKHYIRLEGIHQKFKT